VESLQDCLPSLLYDNSASHGRGPSPWLQFATRRDHWQKVLFLGETTTMAPTPAPGTVPPSWYLVPENAVVSYLTSDTFHRISSWCRAEDSNQAAVRLIDAPGGAGKTRLAQEMSRALFRDGWVAGVSSTRNDMQRAIAGCRDALNDGNHVFIAVDYAEALAREIALLLDELRSSSVDRLRILLLARSSGPWWTNFLSSRSDLMIDHTSMPLMACPGDPAAEYHRAGRAFSHAITGSQEPAVELSAPKSVHQAKSTLEVHASALDAVIGRPPDDPANPLEGVLRHERRYWSRVCLARAGHDFPQGDPLSDRLLALPTLVQAPTLSSAISAVTRFTRSYGRVAAPDLLARSLVTMYPGSTGGWKPLRPDRLAETLVSDVLLA
jgi:hypothetical protein